MISFLSNGYKDGNLKIKINNCLLTKPIRWFLLSTYINILWENVNNIYGGSNDAITQNNMSKIIKHIVYNRP